MPETQIIELAGPDLFGHTHALSDILIASVAEGAAISFLQPLSRQEATRFLEDEIFPEVQRGHRVLFGALSGQQVVGTVQLTLRLPQNQAHRCEVAKMAVHPDFRRQGIAKALMVTLEDRARRASKTLITLDTKTGDPAQTLYRSLGYREAGEIPCFALDPDRRNFHSTTYMYKVL